MADHLPYPGILSGQDLGGKQRGIGGYKHTPLVTAQCVPMQQHLLLLLLLIHISVFSTFLFLYWH